MAASQFVNYERTLLAGAGSGNTRDMAMTIFSGVVLEAFTAASMFYDNSNSFLSVKQLESGASAQWPIMGFDPPASYHVPGSHINEQTTAGTNVKRIRMEQKVITADEYLVNALDIPFTDLNVLHFDVIMPFATKLGRNLAKILDRKIAILGAKAAVTAAVADVHPGGFNVNNVLASSAGAVTTHFPASAAGAYHFRVKLTELAQKFDEGNIPQGSRYLFINPAIRTALRYETNWTGTVAAGSVANASQFPSAFDRNTSSNPSDVSNRVIGNLEGFNIIVTNNMPTQDLSAASGLGTEDAAVAYSGAAGTGGKYQGVFTGSGANKKPVAIALCGADTGSPAIGMVQATGLQTHMEDDQRYNTKFLKAQLMCGLDVLCPWSAGSITISES